MLTLYFYPGIYTVLDMYNIATFDGDVSEPLFLLNKDPLFKIVKGKE